MIILGETPNTLLKNLLGSPQVFLPLLILHGEADNVTDPSVSKALYEQACSNDKKLYKKNI